MYRSTGRSSFFFCFYSVAAHPTSFVSSMCVACWIDADEGFSCLLEHLEPRYASIFLRPVYSLLLIQQQYWISIGYQQILKAQASVSGLKKSDLCIPNKKTSNFNSMAEYILP